MQNIKNLRVLTGSLCLTATLLIGCGNETTIKLDNNSVVYNYEEDTIEGNATFEDLNKYGKLVVLEDSGEVFTRLLIKKEGSVNGRYSSTKYTYAEYYDLETGALMISYKDYVASSERIWITGENLNIVKEEGITSYLVNNDFVKIDYTIEELITFMNDTVIPNLDIDEKELVK